MAYIQNYKVKYTIEFIHNKYTPIIIRFSIL